MRRALFSLGALSVLLAFAGCSESMKQIGVQVLAQTGYVTESQARGVFSVGDKLIKSQEDLTPEQEHYLGRAVAAKLLASYPPVMDSATMQYVNKVGLTVAAASDLPETFGGYHFVIVGSPQINAMSAPGGFVFVSSGFVKKLPDEDALAAVFAHEVAHVVKGHGRKAISNAALFSALAEAGQQGASIASSNYGGSVDLNRVTEVFAGSVTGVVDTLLVKGFDRSQEYEADLYAVQLLQKAGYDPNALVRVLSILKGAAGGEEGGWFATHPAPDDRIDELQDDYAFPQPIVPPGARYARFSAALH